ncbi:MAG: cell division FtsA domain-containing protein [Candidatus Pacebacteria bacterium]|nr:cell division FtsA domain-containing protein [Candidatus Paceibacterota bacterium]
MNIFEKITKKKNKNKYILSLDLGTKFVKALVSYVDYEEDKVVNLGVGKSGQKNGNVVGGRILNVEGVIESCRIAIEEASKMADYLPNEAIIGFSGNTVRISTNSFEIQRENPDKKIEPAELKKIIRSAYSRAMDVIDSELSFREKQVGVNLISADVADFNIDGYRIINPLNFKGHKIKISTSSSFVLSSDFEMINKIAEGLNLRLVKIAYGPYAVLKAVGGQDSFNFNAVMIDVGGNITDVVVVKNGNIEKADMFVLGGNIFTKRIANRLKVSEAKAEEIKINFSKKKLDDKSAQTVEDIFVEDIDLWRSGVELVLEEYSKESLSPSLILFYGGGSQLPGLASSLNELSKSPISFFGKIKLDFLNMGYISDNEDRTKKLDNFQDITILALSHMISDSINAEDTPNVFLEEIFFNK